MPASRQVTRFWLLSVAVEWGLVVIVMIGLLLWRGLVAFSKVTVSTEVSSTAARPIQSQVVSPTLSPTSWPSTASPAPTWTVDQPTQTIAPPTQSSAQIPAGRIVFTCTIEQYNQLCLMNADGSDWKRLTERKVNDYYPSFLSDGLRIVFASNQSGLFEIYLRYLALDDEQQLTDGLGSVSAPDVSLDGKHLAFAARFTGGDSSIWIMNLDDRQARPLTDAQWNEIDPSWSPDGKRIAFAAARDGYVELFTMNAEGGDIRQVTSGVQGIGGRSNWSPDGRWLAFYAGPRGDRDIYLVEAASGKMIRLTQGGNNTAPCFSPDGQWLAFSSSRDGDHEIFIMQLDGSQVTQITNNHYDDWQPSWGP